MTRRHLPLCLTSLLALPLCLATSRTQAQTAPIIPFYEFSSCAMDYPASGTGTTSLQATAGQTFVTVDPPTNSGQTLAYFGFWETQVKFLYQTQVDLTSFVGMSGVNITSIPVTFDLLDASNHRIDRITVTASSMNNVESANFAVPSWANPGAVSFVAAKGDRWLRAKQAIATSAAGYPGAVLTLVGGDTDNNNIIDVDDLTNLLFAFNTTLGDGSGLYEAHPTADFDLNGKIDVDDLTILLFNFNVSGNSEGYN